MTVRAVPPNERKTCAPLAVLAATLPLSACATAGGFAKDTYRTGKFAVGMMTSDEEE